MSQMRFLMFCIFVAVMAMTPLFLFQNYVMPELMTLNQTYQSADEIAQQVAAQQ